MNLNNPCNPGANQDFSAFIGKDLNDKENLWKVN